MTWNINWDSIFPDGDPQNHPFRTVERVDEFRRVIAAINPDIACLQEINQARNPSVVVAIFNTVLAPPGGGTWYGARGGDNFTISKFPFTRVDTQTAPPGFGRRCMTLVDLPNGFSADFYLVNEHYKCCGGPDNEALRQQQSDSMVNWLRDARTAGGNITLASNTPIVILGDLNIVEGPQPLDTLLCGDIIDETTFGPDAPPDWDGSCLLDAHPLHNVAGPDDYTWREDSSPFDPGRLDYVLFSNSRIRIAHRYILNTATMSPDDLAAAGLQQYDTILTPPGDYDHLPLVIDFRFGAAGDLNCDDLVNNFDIDAFVLALTDPAAFEASYPGCEVSRADMNVDGAINNFDIDPFVMVLTGA
ncbi:MAG: endonuclease/exonuclease/phosphatase family protein [Phycisphaerales bacterium]|nr:endonuclease/exonuclease/phosphatase family protein [Phycisphaerales bacterium]